MKKLYRVKFKLIHDSCWTENVVVKTRTLSIYPISSKLLRVSIVSRNDITRALRSSNNVKEVLRIRKIHGGYYYEFTEYTDLTIAGAIFNSKNILYYTNLIENKTEHWEIITTNPNVVKNLKVAYLKIEEIGGVEYFLNNNLTDREIEVLSKALLSGYFEYPRRVKAKDIAKELGITKQAFLYHLRNAINKIIYSYIDS
ncbi:MAG: helix-turn-helix domain-containing protein [Sulfolobaceae archaeon]